MMTGVAFTGFKPDFIEFLSGLRKNNNREWFQAHRDDYETYLVQPACEFVIAMGDCLAPLGSDIHAEPRVRGSIFAINRDTRFARDKASRKTYLDLWFWQSDGPSRERPGYFFRLTPKSLTLGAGMHGFSDAVLERFRQAVVDPEHGSKLETTASGLQDRGIEVGGQTYKRVPAGLPRDHARADWLRHSGLFAAVDQPVSPAVLSDELPGLCFKHNQRVTPLQQWLVDLLAT